jgi:hypothetical protein
VPGCGGHLGDGSAAEFEDDERADDGDEEVGDADPEEGLHAVGGGVGFDAFDFHAEAAHVEEDAVEAPADDDAEDP